MDSQHPGNLWEKYDSVLKDKRPDDFAEAPGMDVPWYWKLLEDGHPNDKFPGVKTRKVDMRPYNEARQPLDRRQLIFYKSIGTMSQGPNLHMCAHLYASDRNSLFIVANHFGVGGSFSQMGSLAHTVVFHAPVESLLLRDEEDCNGPQGSWFCKEDWTDRATVGRGMFHSRIWSPKGTHVMSIMQDGMIRLGQRSEGKTSARNSRL